MKSRNSRAGRSRARPGSGKKPKQRGFKFGLHELMMQADPEYAKRREDWVRFIYLEDRNLEPRAKELVIIGILSALRSPLPHIKLHMEQAVKAGVSKEEILEVVQYAGHWGGTVAQHNGLEAWRMQFAPDHPEVHKALKP